MKKILFFSVWLMTGVLVQQVAAQCSFTGAAVELRGNPVQDPNTGGCKISFDLYFDLQSNPGGKYVYIHIWPTSVYPNYNYANPPVSANLTGSVATFGFYHQSGTLYMMSSYNPDPSVPHFQYTGLTVFKGPGSVAGTDRFEIEGLSITSNQGCAIPQSFTADAWESQSAAAQNVHCFSKGLVFYANDPVVTGLLYCALPHRYAFMINTINASGLTVNYNTYIDNGDGIFNKASDTLRLVTGTTTLDAGNNYRFVSGILDYLPWSEQKPYADNALWVEVTSSALPNDVYHLISNDCIPLPVTLNNFTAFRKSNTVILQWSSAAESGLRGYAVERQDGQSGWNEIAFTEALNKNTEQSYTYADENHYTGVSQYRLRMTDQSGITRYSEIRMVQGAGTAGRVLVFPNPSPDGTLHVLTDIRSGNTIIDVLDMTGRLLQTAVCPASQELVLRRMQAGVYVLRVWFPDMEKPVCQKLIVR